jgi:hypothetical protein
VGVVRRLLDDSSLCADRRWSHCAPLPRSSAIELSDPLEAARSGVRKKGRERWERTHPLHEKMVSHPSFVDRQSPEILLVSDSLRSNDGIGGDELVNGIIATQVVIQR